MWFGCSNKIMSDLEGKRQLDLEEKREIVWKYRQIVVELIVNSCLQP